MQNKTQINTVLLGVLVVLAIGFCAVYMRGNLQKKNISNEIGQTGIANNIESNVNKEIDITPSKTEVKDLFPNTFSIADFPVTFKYKINTNVQIGVNKVTLSSFGGDSLDEVDNINYYPANQQLSYCNDTEHTVPTTVVFGVNSFTKCFSVLSPGSTTFVLKQNSGTVIITTQNKINADKPMYIDLSSVVIK